MSRATIALLLTVLLLAGCSTAQSKYGSKHRDENQLPPQWGHPYSGVVSWAGSWCYFVSPNMKHPHVLLLVAPVFFAFLVIDLPLTLLADTVSAPFELVADAAHTRLTLADECRYSRMHLVND